MATLDLVHEPRGADYRALLEFLRGRAESFSLVWRNGGHYAASADVVRGRLTPHLLRTEGTSEWPGTQLLGGIATVRHYRTALEAVALLTEAGQLYAWQSDALPEDLAFYRADGQVLFASIGHERDAWFELAAVSEAEVRAGLPMLQFHVTEAPPLRPDA